MPCEHTLHAPHIQNYNELLKSYSTDVQNRDVSVSCVGVVWVCGYGVCALWTRVQDGYSDAVTQGHTPPLSSVGLASP